MDKEMTSIKTGNLAEIKTYEVDNRIRFEDGRLYIARIPYINGIQTNRLEKIDVTNEVAEAIQKVLEERNKE